jgi:protein required for attachment to host cells
MGSAQMQPNDALRNLGRDYHHLQQEHEREGASGATRRRLGAELQQLAARFERTLTHWVSDEPLRDAWRHFLYGRGPAPDEPRVATPPVFKGTTPSGGHVEILPAGDGGYDVVLDGAHLDHHQVPWEAEPERREPVRINGQLCEERFDASTEAIEAMAEFLATPGAAPPWAHARELVEDGLVDAELALTPRGARALASLRGPAQPPALTAYCVLAADSARARVFTLDGSPDVTEPTLRKLVEVSDLTNPALRARDADLFTDSRPGLQHAFRDGPSHGVSDRRDARRREMRRRFAEMAVEEAAEVWRRFPSARLIIAASPGVLGDLRAALARHRDAPRDVVEVARELANRTPTLIHDALAHAGAVPRRGRLPPPAV